MFSGGIECRRIVQVCLTLLWVGAERVNVNSIIVLFLGSNLLPAHMKPCRNIPNIGLSQIPQHWKVVNVCSYNFAWVAKASFSQINNSADRTVAA